MRNRLVLMFALVLSLSFASIALAQTVELIVGMSEAPETLSHRGVEKVAEIAYEKSNGRLVITAYPGQALGPVASQIEGVMTGTIDMYWGGISWYEKFLDEFKIFSLGWAFQDPDHLIRFTETDYFGKMRQRLADERNLHILSNHGIRSPRIMLSRKPVFTPEDMQGLRVRVPDQPMYLKTWAAVGSNPVRIDYGEVYMALAQGIVDAMENPIESFYGMGFYEVAPYITYTNHLLNPYSLVINVNVWNNLDPELQQILQEAAIEGSQWYTSVREETEAAQVADIVSKDGFFIQMNVRRFMDKVADLGRQLEKEGEWEEGLFDYVQSLVK